MGYPSFFKKISITLDINVYLENLKKIFSDIWMPGTLEDGTLEAAETKPYIH